MSTQRRPHPRWGNETQRSNLSLIKKRHEQTLFLTEYHNLTQDVWSHTFITNISAHRRKWKPTAHTLFHFTHSVILCSTSPLPHCYTAAAILHWRAYFSLLLCDPLIKAFLSSITWQTNKIFWRDFLWILVLHVIICHTTISPLVPSPFYSHVSHCWGFCFPFFWPYICSVSAGLWPAVAPAAPGCIWSLQTPDEPPVLLTCPGPMKSAKPGQTQTRENWECTCMFVCLCAVGVSRGELLLEQ